MREQVAQGGRMDAFVIKIDALAATLATGFADLWQAVAEMRGTQKTVAWFVMIGLPLIAGLEIWDRLFK